MDLFRTVETIFVPGWYKNSFNGTKQIRSLDLLVSIVRNKSIRVVQTVAHNTNFDSFLVVKKVLCAPICAPRMDLFRTTETIFVPGWYKNSFNGTKRMKISAVFS
jgi:hypothetical protein